MRRAFVFGLLGLALAACASGASAGTQRFSGVWDWHFETSAFVADDGEGPYWLSADRATWAQMTAPFEGRTSPWGRAHIVVEGELSAPGAYGHLGAYERELRVTRVLETRFVTAER